MKCFMGIDCGTSGIKVVLLSEAGELLGSGYSECDLITPRPGWVEQPPESWWNACCEAVKAAVHNSGHGRDVAGIGFSGQMQGCLPLDGEGRPIGNCIIWLDQRAGQETAEIESLLPDKEAVRLTANHCLNSFWAPKLLWLRNHRPEDFARTRKVLFTKDYIRYRMTGEIATEVSDASLSFFLNVAERRWAPEVFRRLGLDPALAPERLLESSEVAGFLLPEIAAEWGLPAGIPVAAGGGDQPVGGVGGGIVKPGLISSTIGTSGVVFGCTAQPLVDSQRRAIMTMAHAVPGQWCFLGLVLSAGGTFKWLRDTFFRREKQEYAAKGLDVYDYMTALAEKARPGCEGLMCLPYLNGEKTPITDENARGVLFGLSYRHGPGEIARSVMEGVTFAMRDTIEICRSMGLNVSEVRSSGGGAKSPLWRQIQADIYQANVVTMNLEEGPAAGAAILAAVASGYFRDVAEGCDAWLKPVSTTEPIRANAELYEAYYQTYHQLYADLKQTFRSQAEIVERTL